MPCAICANTHNNRRYTAREMMYGLRDPFVYVECAACGCMHIEMVPNNLAAYYPSGYYSFRARSRAPLAWFIRRLRDSYALRGSGLVGQLLLAFHPGDMNVLQSLQSLARLRPLPQSHILDVGCGAGLLLESLHQLGFTNLMGLEPYLDTDHMSAGGVPIYKQSVQHLAGTSIWDIIMFHHSFEHIATPRETLHSVARLLKPHGVCLIRMPTVSSFAWKNYRTDWVQLDAPRHLWLYSLEGVRLLAAQTNLLLEDVVYDSTAFQFWASEQYRQDIPLMSDRSYAINPAHALFSQADIRTFQQKAAVLNRARQGDTAVFYLRKPPETGRKEP